MPQKYLLIIEILKVLVRLSEALEQGGKFWLQGVGLTSRSLEQANFSSYNQREWYNLRGTDFSYCNLRGSNFREVIGGFSLVRPLCLLVVICLALVITAQISPYLDEMFQPLEQIISVPSAFESAFVLAQVILLYLLISLILLERRSTLPTEIAQSSRQADPKVWVIVRQGVRGFLAFLTLWLGSGAYLSLSFANFMKDDFKLDSIIAIGIAILLGLGAITTLVRSVGQAFVFSTSFVKADLGGANFTQAKLSGCNFYGANLRAANLQGGDFSGCNFKQADLRGADLRGASLKGANFTGARIDENISLSEVLK